MGANASWTHPVIREVLLRDIQKICGAVVDREAGWRPEEHEREHHRHEHQHLLLRRIGAGRRHQPLLPEARHAHQNRENKIWIVRGQIVNPADPGRTAQLD